MSVRFKLCRQTELIKTRKCLLATFKSADKTREKKQMSASPTIWWQTKARKSGKCLPATNEVGRQNKRKEANVCQSHNLLADKKQGNPENICQPPISRQTKQEKTRKCLPVSQFAGRQSQENQENICQLQNLPADRIKKL